MDNQISIADIILTSKARRIRRIPHKANWASQMGHPCLRYLVYERTKWDEKKMHNSTLQSIFDLGNDFEQIVLRELAEAGFQTIEQQRAFYWDKYEISGHIDAKIILGDRAIPIEIKSCSPYVFDSISDVSSIRYHKYDYLRGYLAQITLYMLLDGKDQAILLFKNKVSGLLKDIWVNLDYEFGESIIQKAEIINQHIKDGTLPDGMDYDSNQCDNCGYVHLCLPEVIGRGVDISSDEELMGMLARYWELKPIHKEYEDIDKQLKPILEGKEKLLCGEFYIDGKWIKRTDYDVPAEVREPYRTEKYYWRKQIRKAE